MFFTKITHVDRLLGTLGILFGLIIISLYTISPTIHIFSIGLPLVLSCSLYLILNTKQLVSYQDSEISKNVKISLDIFFLLSFSLSLIVLHISGYRPLSYYIIYSFCVASVSISIYFSSYTFEYILQIIKIFLLSFNIKYSIFNLSGLIPGVDSITHASMNNLLSITGNINALTGKEMYFPIMHIQTAIMELITNSSISGASSFAVIVPFVIFSVFIYLFAKYFFGEKIGLFSMLLFSISDYNIYWGSAPQTTTYGIMLYCLILYLFVKSYSTNTKSKPLWIGLQLFFIFILILTHAISSFIFLITILSLFVGISIYDYFFNGSIFINSNTKKVLTVGSITLISLFDLWFVALYSTDGMSFFDTIVYTLYSSITGHAQLLNRPESISSVAATLPPFTERFINTCGFLSFLFFGVLGSLYCLSNKYRNRYVFSCIFTLLVLFGITFAFPLFGIRNIMPSRWFSFEYFFLSILASFSIFKLAAHFKSGRSRLIFISIVFIAFSFFMSASTVSNLDSTLWLKNNTISTTYSYAEIAGAERVSNFGVDITSDEIFGAGVISVYMNKTFNAYTQSKHIKEGSIFLWRSYMENRPIRTYMNVQNRSIASSTILGKEFHSKLDKYNKIYDNRELSAYAT